MCRAGLTQPTKACLKEHTNVIARVGPRHASVLNTAVSDQSGLNLGGSRHAIRPTNHSTQPTIKMDPFKRSSTPDMLKRSSTPENIFQYNPDPTVESRGPIVGASGPIVGASGPIVESCGPIVESRGPIVGASGPIVESPGPIVGNSGSSEQVTGLAGHSIPAPDVPAVKRSPAKKTPVSLLRVIHHSARSTNICLIFRRTCIPPDRSSDVASESSIKDMGLEASLPQPVTSQSKKRASIVANCHLHNTEDL
ncbi:hypothetical protein PGT21_031204 [Puccinia graminis f. sp. tritici]|uniref:Uncharacterized protein n=1 Tax=Puccinia graminis f. sp. tritici TaxID=56615 RepID=A0A5B0P401_PUCGR|nr:hypothetical protein PGT21_031204 [Puccinia graminis f. sp. tritici]